MKNVIHETMKFFAYFLIILSCDVLVIGGCVHLTEMQIDASKVLLP